MDRAQEFLGHLSTAIASLKEAIADFIDRLADAFDRIRCIAKNAQRGWCYNGSSLITWHRCLRGTEMPKTYWYRLSFKHWRHAEYHWNTYYHYERDRKAEARKLRRLKERLRQFQNTVIN